MAFESERRAAFGTSSRRRRGASREGGDNTLPSLKVELNKQVYLQGVNFQGIYFQGIYFQGAQMQNFTSTIY